MFVRTILKAKNYVRSPGILGDINTEKESFSFNFHRDIYTSQTFSAKNVFLRQAALKHTWLEPTAGSFLLQYKWIKVSCFNAFQNDLSSNPAKRNHILKLRIVGDLLKQEVKRLQSPTVSQRKAFVANTADNFRVVLYCLNILVMNQCHIVVELCVTWVRGNKYLFKLVCGHKDREWIEKCLGEKRYCKVCLLQDAWYFWAFEALRKLSYFDNIDGQFNVAILDVNLKYHTPIWVCKEIHEKVLNCLGHGLKTVDGLLQAASSVMPQVLNSLTFHALLRRKIASIADFKKANLNESIGATQTFHRKNGAHVHYKYAPPCSTVSGRIYVASPIEWEWYSSLTLVVKVHRSASFADL